MDQLIHLLEFRVVICKRCQYSISNVCAGLTMRYTVFELGGPSASVGMLLLIFMAVISTLSSSLIGVSSIISSDTYRTHTNPPATGKRVVGISHLGVIFYGVFITGFTLMLNYTGANISAARLSKGK
jgi:Na+/proline symporter